MGMEPHLLTLYSIQRFTRHNCKLPWLSEPGCRDAFFVFHHGFSVCYTAAGDLDYESAGQRQPHHRSLLSLFGAVSYGVRKHL